MTNRILAIVVSYYPDKVLLEKNISAFFNHVDKVLIWENTPERDRLAYRYVDETKVDYVGDGVNSISHALNFAWRYAKQKGYAYLLTMDQDSVLIHFEKLKDFALLHSSEMLIMGPSFLTINTEGSFPVATKCEEVITSGMLIPVKVLDCVGGYNEKLTIDGIDTELCLRANLHGIFTYQVNGCRMTHKFGQPLVKYRRGVKYVINSYPAKRLRSILKAHVYLMRKYPNMSDTTRSFIKAHYIKARIKEILLFEDHKLSKIFNIAIGIIEGALMKV